MLIQSFEQLSSVDDTHIKDLLSEIDNLTLVTALAYSEDAIVEKIQGFFSRRAAILFLDDVAHFREIILPEEAVAAQIKIIGMINSSEWKC